MPLVCHRLGCPEAPASKRRKKRMKPMGKSRQPLEDLQMSSQFSSCLHGPVVQLLSPGGTYADCYTDCADPTVSRTCRYLEHCCTRSSLCVPTPNEHLTVVAIPRIVNWYLITSVGTSNTWSDVICFALTKSTSASMVSECRACLKIQGSRVQTRLMSVDFFRT